MLVTREQFDVIVASRQQKARSKGPHHRSMEVTQSSASSNTLTVIEDLKIIAKGGEPSQRMIARREAIQKRFIPD
ncbi:hypothetical protein LH19_06660 [Sphingopyxis macrogoltabida]|nr:hypothetical protein LH19_06660 [Sphingopyxis macrogoltabida]